MNVLAAETYEPTERDLVEFSEWLFAKDLADLIEKAGKPYAIARAKQIIAEAEGVS